MGCTETSAAVTNATTKTSRGATWRSGKLGASRLGLQFPGFVYCSRLPRFAAYLLRSPLVLGERRCLTENGHEACRSGHRMPWRSPPVLTIPTPKAEVQPSMRTGRTNTAAPTNRGLGLLILFLVFPFVTFSAPFLLPTPGRHRTCKGNKRQAKKGTKKKTSRATRAVIWGSESSFGDAGALQYCRSRALECWSNGVLEQWGTTTTAARSRGR